jgi:hypothetical protein
MKYLRLALVIFASALEVAHAQDEGEERHAPPTEIPDFSNLDEYIYEPKSTVVLGFRHLSGPKTKFSGHGTINAPESPGDATSANIARVYHDGSVSPDARTEARLDASGNPVIDPQTGAQIMDPISPDGRTNTWSFLSDSQLTANGGVAFHTYSADVLDAGARSQSGRSSNGMELAMLRDMGKLFSSRRITWNLMAGMSVNDISSQMSGQVQANVRTTTDVYSLFGQTPPTPAPYAAPSFSTQTVLDPSGNPVLNSDGTTQTTQVETTVLLGNKPTRLSDGTTSNATSVTNRWKLKGAYYTFRAGPTIWIPITTRLRASISVGAALIYSAANYSVTQTLTPDAGPEITETDASDRSKLLPGYYADATLQFDMTERAGLYAGAVFQSAGSYTQHLDSATAHYATKIDLGNQDGFRAGMTVRF